MRSLLRIASARRSRRQQPQQQNLDQSTSPVLRLTTYEYIPGGGELALVRLVAQLGGVSPDEIVLRASGGERHQPLPASRPVEPSDSGLWRAAFSVPLATVESGRLTLVLGDRGEVPLPPPVRRSLGIEEGPAAPSVAASDDVDTDQGARDDRSEARRERTDTAGEERLGATGGREPHVGEDVEPRGEAVDGEPQSSGADIRQRLDRALAGLEDANTKREEVEHRCQHLEAQVAELRQRLHSLASEAESQREAAQRHEHDAELLRQELARERDAAKAHTDDAAIAADLEAAERRLAEFVQRLARAAEVEQKLRARLEGLEAAERSPMAAAQQQQDDEREQLEATITELRARVAELEHHEQAGEAPAEATGEQSEVEKLRRALDAQRVVEDDLRAMLASSKRQAEEARREVMALRDRLAASPRPPGRREEQPDGQSWSALDQDLIERLTKAKQLSGSD